MLDCEADSDLIQKFIDLCRCKYKNCKVYKILPGLFVETGDISNNDGSGKDSENSIKLSKKTWNCENYLQPRSVSMVLEDDKSVGSKFEISLKKTAKFRNQVVIGRVVKGFEVVVALERFGSRFGRPIKAVFIENCGIMK